MQNTSGGCTHSNKKLHCNSFTHDNNTLRLSCLKFIQSNNNNYTEVFSAPSDNIESEAQSLLSIYIPGRENFDCVVKFVVHFPVKIGWVC